MKSVFILCAGQASRFDGDAPKQHLLVDGERLIERTVRMLVERGYKPFVVVNEHTKDLACGMGFLISMTATTCGTIIATRHLWFDGVAVILLSDVYDTDAALDAILASEKSNFWTDGSDIFAVSMRESDYDTFIGVCKQADSGGENHGRIWEAYRHWHGRKWWPLYPEDNKPMLAFISDRTQDFDVMQDYRDFMAGVSKNHALNNPHAVGWARWSPI